EAIVKQQIEETNLAYRDQQAVVQARKLDQTRLETSVAALDNGLARMREQLAQHKLRKQGLLDKGDNSAAPLEALNQSLQGRLAEHKIVETTLLAMRDEISGLDNTLREQQSALSKSVEAVNEARSKLENTRMTLQDKQVRQQSLTEQATRDSCAIDSVELPEECPSLAECEVEISEFERKIASIGAVNLVAIDEYESQSERAEYLERQHKDLLEALETLEQVIRKIDKETRIRFEDTYTALDKNFTAYFPKLFGGGKASLSLTSDDWLTTGITVMAQPPGKRNSTIHLLSGGEKALTAVSLLFALFELNPAPFCMMDEVDAPLDDANVDRFCDTLKSLSEHAQIIVITHNKITMQAASSLIGVTMNEPGVSRVVSVDVEQAMELAE
ncbi:MAG: chromosome segregation protein SMC, partial [Methylococcales bacterium]|nr:chromosome segregation protein SMC [Methylococcales bacterium]